uniref:Uncharacterized protein n=1 Tax=Anguilla anguilla TaxID=7936 RepID=A0A0E9Q1J1_ANGAN
MSSSNGKGFSLKTRSSCASTHVMYFLRRP